MELPLEFCRRMEILLGNAYTDFTDAFQRPAGRGLRVNTLKCSVEAFQRIFPIPLFPSPFSPQGFILRESLKAGADPLHHAGAYYMQEPSAMSAVTVLDPQPGEAILDLCAAPGGKTTQIAAALAGSGLVWANEYVRSRAQVLLQNLERCGVRNSVVSNAEPAVLASRLPGWFDGVLVDAPCSGEGMFRKEPAALDHWSLDNIRLCARRQKDILYNASRMVRPGGRLVFSTCTFAPEENEWSVIRLLQACPDFELEDCGVSFGQPAFPLEQVASFALPEDVLPDNPPPLERCRRIFPQHGGEGHFVALLRRRGNPSRLSDPLDIPVKKDTFCDLFYQLYKELFYSPPQGYPAVFGQAIRLLPHGLPDTKGLGVLAAGVAAGEIRGWDPGRAAKNRQRETSMPLRIEPCHALFMAARPQDCRSLLELPLDDPRLARFLRGEEIPAPGCQGWTGVAVEGVMTGFGKASGGVLKNRYPKGLRILG